MRIIVIGPVYPYRGGIAHYTTQLANALDAAGIQEKVISFKRQYPKWLYPGVSDKEPGERTQETKAQFILDPLYPWTWFKTARLISSERPDLVVIQWWTTFWAPASAVLGWLLKRSNLKITYIIHNVLPHEQHFWDKWITKLALSKARSYIVQSQREYKRLIKLFPNANIFECPLPVDTFFTNPNLTQTECKQKLGIAEKDHLFLFFGFVRPYKGLKYLLEALGILYKKGIKPKVIIAGEFWEDKAEFIDLINKLQIKDQIQILDFYISNEQVATLFSAADCLVAPYSGGTQSAAAGIALGFGLPMIVTTNVAEGIAEENKHFLQIVPPMDAQALADAMQEFIMLPEHLTKPHQPAKNDWERLVNTLLLTAN